MTFKAPFKKKKSVSQKNKEKKKNIQIGRAHV